MKSKVIALSAISAAFIAIFLTLGAYIDFFDLVAVLIASIFVLMPLYLGSYLGCVLSYLVGTVIAFLFSGFNIYSVVFPLFLLYFGIYPIIKCAAMQKNFNKHAFCAISLVWSVAAAFGTYFFYVAVIGAELLSGLPHFVVDNIYIIVAIIGVVFYFLFDKFVFVTRVVINKYLSKIIK